MTGCPGACGGAEKAAYAPGELAAANAECGQACDRLSDAFVPAGRWQIRVLPSFTEVESTKRNCFFLRYTRCCLTCTSLVK